MSRTRYILVALITLCMISLFGNDVFAEGITPATVASGFMDGLIQGINIILGILTLFITPAIIFAGWLISPDWTSGDLFNLRPIFYGMWITVSNIVYFIYAILIIFIALATIFNSDHYGYKAMLPKLAIGILTVPLTWFGVQFMISLGNYVTAAVVAIPRESMQATLAQTESSWVNKATIPKNIYFYNVDPDLSSSGALKKLTSCEGTTACIKPIEVLNNAGGIYSPLLIYAYNVFRVQDLKELPTGVMNGVGSIVSIVHQGIVGIILFFIFGILVLGLVMVLLMRAIKLWFYAIFSPFFSLQFVIGWGFLWDQKDTFDIKEFIGLCFVPAAAGLCLGFWLVIIGAVQSPAAPASGNPECTETQIQIPAENLETGNFSDGKGCRIVTAFWGGSAGSIIRGITPSKSDPTKFQSVSIINVAGINMIYYGSPTPKSEAAEKETKAANDKAATIEAGKGTFGTMIVDIIAIAFIWAAFMIVKSMSKVAAAALAPFETMGKNIGKLGMSIPKNMPVLPGGLSVSGLERVSGIPGELYESKKAEKYAGYSKGIAKAMGLEPAAYNDVLKTKLKQSVTDGSGETQKRAWSEVVNVGVDMRYNVQNKQAIDDMWNSLKGVSNIWDKINGGWKEAATEEEKIKGIYEFMNGKGKANGKTYQSILEEWSNKKWANAGPTPGTGWAGGGAFFTTKDFREQFAWVQIEKRFETFKNIVEKNKATLSSRWLWWFDTSEEMADYLKTNYKFLTEENIQELTGMIKFDNKP